MSATGSTIPQKRPRAYPQQQLTPAQVQQLKQQHLLRQQQQQLLQQQLRQGNKNPKDFHFATTTQEILRKYAKYPASITFHIYESHYRFNNSQDSAIIQKDSPMVKDFLHHVLREEIPVEMSELLKDFSIRSYDGCLILQVYDHRNMVQINQEPSINPQKQSDLPKEASEDKSLQSKDQTEATSTSTGNSTSSSGSTIVSRPKTYRTLLRPTQLSIYYDLLYHTDSALARFSDNLSLQMESEILTLSNRKLDLLVPLNPYLCSEYLQPEQQFPEKVWDDKIQDYKLIHSHRKAVERPPRKLHEEELILHKSSDYEEIMFLLSNKYKRIDESLDKKLVVVGSSALAAATAPKPSSKDTSNTNDSKNKKGSKGADGTAPTVVNTNTAGSTGQFMRLRFIEEIRKRREAQKAQEAKAALQAQNDNSMLNNTAPGSFNQVNKTANGQRQGRPMNNAGLQQQHPQPPTNNAKTQQQLMAEKAQILRAQQIKAQQLAQARQQFQQEQQAEQRKESIRRQQYRSASPHEQNQNISNRGTPVMNNVSTLRPASQPQNMNSALQQQQQQIFQNSLTPQEQQTFRQLQSRMNAFAMMGNTGVAPNRAHLTPQQQQLAMQQAKLIQHQLIQKFPVYFQRLRLFQLLQEQRLQQTQASSGGTQQFAPNRGSNNMVPGGMTAQQKQMINQQMLQHMSQQEKRMN
ncbi:uncharacterized protein PRCAT00004446001 [Priceomyces carsonii]|uniref:uncharacterized protein n=1 Tax=Priceomyces carsonii TaxID=28549 RepID=UPI002ED9D7D7|nr:unnamed protein product [Priceomyces carsonii]